MSKIYLLTKDLINKIAAGEVVERPASAVKELIENSIDAGATEIIISLEEGGLKKIEVIDNGQGMDEKDAAMAFVQHATSKIQSETDLQSIFTLGFRGEALASISSIADVTLHTFNGLNTPYVSFIENQEIKTEIGQGRSIGTTITINNIYNKVPARRKFLRSSNTEYKYILDVFTFMALSHPAVAFKLVKDGKTIFNFNSNQSLEQRTLALFPTLSESSLLPIIYDSPRIRISGFIGHPSTARQDSSQQFIFVNKRFVKDSLISKAIKEGFASTLMNHNYPIYFLFLELNPDSIDVNIHPRKLEVKYTDPSSIFVAVKIAVEKTLQNSLQKNFSSQNELSTYLYSI